MEYVRHTSSVKKEKTFHSLQRLNYREIVIKIPTWEYEMSHPEFSLLSDNDYDFTEDFDPNMSIVSKFQTPDDLTLSCWYFDGWTLVVPTWKTDPSASGDAMKWRGILSEDEVLKVYEYEHEFGELRPVGRYDEKGDLIPGSLED